MHKKGLYIVLIFSVLFLSAFAVFPQDEKVNANIRLSWQPSMELYPGHALLSFDGAVNHDSLGFLPVYKFDLPAGFFCDVANVTLAEEVYEPVILPDPSEFPDLDLIEANPRIIVSTHYSKKNPLQSVYILPLRKSPSGSGFERLVSFGAEILRSGEVTARMQAGNRSMRNYAEHSVLSSGDWFRIAVKETGVYRITYDDLVGMGIDPAGIDPANIRLFGNGSGMLEEANSMPRPDDLMENAIHVEGEEDGTFDTEDYILFYGEGPVTKRYVAFFLTFEPELNLYTDQTFYFLNTGEIPGRRIGAGEPVIFQPNLEINSFQEVILYEKEERNLIKSGKIWYGEVFSAQTEYSFPFELPGIVISEPVYVKASLAGRSTTKTNFNLYADGALLTELELPSIVLGSQIYARPVASNYEEFYASGEQAEIGISFVKPGSMDIGWLNNIVINYIRRLEFTGGQLGFRDMREIMAGNIARYQLQTDIPVSLWEVTDPSAVSVPALTQESGGVSFLATADRQREFIAFDGTEFLVPEFVEKVVNQDLHGMQPVDYIIVSHPMFLDQSHRLADFHRQYNGMTVAVITPQQIYNEFSSGAQDVSAIRDFMKMLYDRALPGEEPRYLLLFGDASYDYRDYIPEDNNLVPAYQSKESLKSAASFVTDDYFGCLDEDEGSGGAGTMDIGVGRFPVHTIEQAGQMVTKVIGYMSPKRENFGPWRNSVHFIGDDEDNNTHLNQAEGLVHIADSLGRIFNANKIYLDAYQQLKTPGGNRYPDVNGAIDQAVDDGCLIINYTGHGGEIAWADERVLDIPAIQSYKNISHLPAFITATCEFSRYDDPGLVSAGELVFLNPDGAGIGLFTTTRLAFSQSNYALNKRFYYEAFVIDSLTGEYPRMGDLIRVAKTPSNQNIKNFVLLGDPALMLAYPKMRVKTLSITNEVSGRLADTLNALSKVTIEGQVEDLQGNRLEEFNGIVYPSVFDKPVLYKTRGNDQASRVTEFYIQDKKIFKGEATVTNGRFSFTFVVPRDILYQYGEGKISYYALDTVSLTDANGYDPVWIGGSDANAIADDEGPAIGLYLNTYSFLSGDYTTSEPTLLVDLFDESGINTVGNGIGHDIVAIIDGDYQQPMILNEEFTPETDSYQNGSIVLPLGRFEDGLHTLTLRAWDVLNNSSEKTIEFIVDVGARLAVSDVRNYPNPFSESTNFSFAHNKPGNGLDVTIRIYSLMGQQLSVLEYDVNNESTESGPLYWDGKDDAGNELPSGLYVYQLLVKSDDGFVSSVSQKFMHYR